MKKALILAYDYPPYHSIGAQRPNSWYRYFKQFGVQPTVITRHWEVIQDASERNFTSKIQETHTQVEEEGKTILVPYRANIRDKMIMKYGLNKFVLLRKVLSLLINVGQYYSFMFDALSPIYKAAKDELDQEKYDVIITTGEPFVLFRHAALLSAQYNIPWVADYRDGWTTMEHITYYNRLEKFFLKYVFKRIEKNLLSNVALITTASPNYKTALEELHQGKRVEVIYNGYDDDLIELEDNVETETEFFKLAYPGTLYPYQPIEIFLEGLKLFKKQKPDLKLKVFFYGMNFNEPQKNRVLQASEESIQEHLVFTGKVPKAELYRITQNTHLFILLGHKSVKALAGKLFDYLLLQRQILFVQPDEGPQQTILEQCETGLFCEDAEKVCSYLEKYYEAWENRESFQYEAKGYQQFSREVQAERMVGLIRNI